MTVLVAAGLVGAGVWGVAWGLAARARARAEALARLLEVELAQPSVAPQALAGMLERAGAVAERALRGTATARRVQVMLGQAGWQLRPGELAAGLAAGAAALGLVVWAVTGSPGAGMAAAGLAPPAALGWLDRRGRRRLRRLEDQLPAVLGLLAGSLDAGSSVLHALELVVEEGQEPLASELARVVGETRVGRPLVESLQAMAARVGSRDLDWTVEAIRVQLQTGGRLADTLRVLADFMRARREVREEVRALAAEARLSARILTALPLLVGGYFLAFRRDYFEPMYTTGLGRTMLAAAAAGVAVGTLWMRRIVRVEV